MTISERALQGCRPVPLASYLKALGVLRIVGEQRDAGARGLWADDHFVLRSELSARELERFFLEDYRPTPILAPWNGGSGFYPKDNKRGIDGIGSAAAGRLTPFRESLEVARSALEHLGIRDKVSKEEKPTLLQACRATLPDAALDWMDAAFLLTEDGAKYPPLLGTGGNDGRLDFTNNFMQRLLDLIDPSTGEATSSSPPLLRAALFDEANGALEKAAIGQFLPAGAGGPNAERGFEAESLINPWDFVLMLEGAVAFAAAAVRRMERDTAGAWSFPFTVRQVGVGYASASEDDESSARAEMWMPLWSRPASHLEVRHLLSEGRARLGARGPRNGVDFARAVASLGVDRGINAFQRYGFQVRNGLSYLAVPLNRFPVRAQPRVSLLQDIDTWLDRFRGRASSNNAPASAGRALRQLETAILDLCQHGDGLRLQQVLIALGQCERIMATSGRWTEETHLRPVPPLSPEWLRQSDDGSTELRLAAALASVWGTYSNGNGRDVTMPLRRQLEPVSSWKAEDRLKVAWDWDAGRDVVWEPTHVDRALNAVLQRRLTMGVQSGARDYPDTARYRASLGDISDFIEGRTDDAVLTDLLWGCVLIDWVRASEDHMPERRVSPRSPLPGAFYALLKLCFPGAPLRLGGPVAPPAIGQTAAGLRIPLAPRIHRLAASGRGSDASVQAVRRLRGSGLGPALGAMQVAHEAARRSAAALLFPVGQHDLKLLASLVLRPEEPEIAPDASSAQPDEGRIA